MHLKLYILLETFIEDEEPKYLNKCNFLTHIVHCISLTVRDSHLLRFLIYKSLNMANYRLHLYSKY